MNTIANLIKSETINIFLFNDKTIKKVTHAGYPQLCFLIG